MDQVESGVSLESLLGPKQIGKLDFDAKLTTNGRCAVIQVDDPTLIDPILERVRLGISNKHKEIHPRKKPEEVICDFRKRQSHELIEEIETKFQQRNKRRLDGKFQVNNPVTTFLLVDPKAESTDIYTLREVLKWAPSLVILTKPAEQYPDPVKNMIWDYFNNYHIVGKSSGPEQSSQPGS